VPYGQPTQHSPISVEERQHNNQPDKRLEKQFRNERLWCNERQRRWQMGGGVVSRAYAITSQTKSQERGVMRGKSVMRGSGTGRWEAAA
jgi:hypothetical protein